MGETSRVLYLGLDHDSNTDQKVGQTFLEQEKGNGLQVGDIVNLSGIKFENRAISGDYIDRFDFPAASKFRIIAKDAGYYLLDRIGIRNSYSGIREYNGNRKGIVHPYLPRYLSKPGKDDELFDYRSLIVNPEAPEVPLD